MTQVQALLFDVDGTLADTERHGHLPAWNQAFEVLGLSWRWSVSEYRKLLLQPGGEERLRHYLISKKPGLGKHAAAEAADPDAWLRRVHELKSRRFESILSAGKLPLRRGVARLLDEAQRADVAVALVSNASQLSLESFLRHGLGRQLQQAVDLVIGGEQLAQKKPAPDAYHKALEILEVPAAAGIVFEDSAMGLRSATGAGLATVVTVNADTRGQDFSDALLVLDSLGSPQAPFKVLAGDALGHRWVNLAMLDDLLRRQAVTA